MFVKRRQKSDKLQADAKKKKKKRALNFHCASHGLKRGRRKGKRKTESERKKQQPTRG